MATAEKKGAVETEVAAAWGEYLESTRGQERRRYEDVEPHAWVLLKARLRKLGVKLGG